MSTDSVEEHLHDAAVTFAGQDRWLVSRIVRKLQEDFDVFYDEDNLAESWGEEGVEYFTDVYMNRARYVVMFISAHYVESQWTRIEKRAALARAAKQKGAYVLPVKLDDTELDGMPPTVIYLDAREHGIEGIVRIAKEKLAPKAEGSEDPDAVRLPEDLKTPRTPGELQAVMEQRPDAWEYLLWAGALYIGMQEFDSKYADHLAGYAPSTGEYLSTAQAYLKFVSRISRDGLRVTGDFNAVLSKEVQTQAFGEEGQPGNADRILLMARRILDVYRDFMDWAAKLRGTGTSGEHATKSLLALANASNINVERIRGSIEDVVRWADRLSTPDESHDFVMTLTIDLDEGYMAEYEREKDLAVAAMHPDQLD